MELVCLLRSFSLIAFSCPELMGFLWLGEALPDMYTDVVFGTLSRRHLVIFCVFMLYIIMLHPSSNVKLC